MKEKKITKVVVLVKNDTQIISNNDAVRIISGGPKYNLKIGKCIYTDNKLWKNSINR